MIFYSVFAVDIKSYGFGTMFFWGIIRSLFACTSESNFQNFIRRTEGINKQREKMFPRKIFSEFSEEFTIMKPLCQGHNRTLSYYLKRRMTSVMIFYLLCFGLLYFGTFIKTDSMERRRFIVPIFVILKCALWFLVSARYLNCRQIFTSTSSTHFSKVLKV